MRLRSVLIPLIFLSAVAASLALASVSALAQTSSIQDMANLPGWQALLHRHHHESSKVIRKGFFFASDGAEHAEAELAATIKAFRMPQALDLLNEHPQCRFPARKEFLAKQGFDFPLVTCPDYSEWRRGIAAKSLSLVYASAYNENAASMFGHTFLRINPFPFENRDAARDKLLGYTVGFLANVDPSDDSFSYAFKGITGQYPGVFQIDPYYVTTAIYSSSESRDLWEYELSLTQDELNFLVAHLWELYHNAAFDYFFFDENCSLYLLSFLQVARPDQDLVSQFGSVVLPLTTVRVLQAQGWLHAGVVQRPSLEKKLRRRYAGLTAVQRLNFEGFIEQSALSLDVLDSEINEALLLYYDFKKQDKKGFLSDNDKNKLQALRNQLATQKAPAPSKLQPDAAISSELPPDQSPENPLGRLAYLWQNSSLRHDSQSFIGIGFRAGIHGLDDLDQGYEPWSEVRVLDGTVHLPMKQPKHIYLKHLDLVSVTSLTPLTLWQKKWSWHLGLTSEYLDPDYRLHPLSQTITGSAAGGFTWQNLSRQFLFSFLPKIRLEQQTFGNHDRRVWLSAWIHLGWQNRNFKTLSSFDYAIDAQSPNCQKPSWTQTFSWKQDGFGNKNHQPDIFLDAQWEGLGALKPTAACAPAHHSRAFSFGFKLAS